MPSLATIGDETADGEFDFGPERPLALFDAPRVDYSLRRLVHYTGSDWRAMQPWVLLTNYHRYVDQFVHWGLKQLHARRRRVEKAHAARQRRHRLVDLASRGGSARGRRRLASLPDARLSLCARTGGGDQPGQHRRRARRTPRPSPTISRCLRPHCWLMVGHCAGLRQSQVIGDYVLAHAYLRQDNILDEAVPPDDADSGARRSAGRAAGGGRPRSQATAAKR